MSNKTSGLYKIDITGAQVQNVGLRKNLHRILDEEGMTGIAVNDPYKNSVDAYISGSDAKRKRAYTKLRGYIKEKTGHEIKIKETLSQHGLADVQLSRRDLNDTANTQYLLYMMRNKNIDRTKIRGLGLKKSEDDIIPRFRLKKNKSNEYIGKLPQIGIDQLYGKAAHYDKFRKHNLQSSLENAMGRMHELDGKTLSRTLKRRDMELAYK